MGASDKSYIPDLWAPWASIVAYKNVKLEAGGTRLAGGIYEPRYLLVYPSSYDVVTVGIKTGSEINGFDLLYIRAGGLKADVAPMFDSFNILFFKDDASTTRALYDRYLWKGSYEVYRNFLDRLSFPEEANVADLKKLFGQGLGSELKRRKKS